MAPDAYALIEWLREQWLMVIAAIVAIVAAWVAAVLLSSRSVQPKKGDRQMTEIGVLSMDIDREMKGDDLHSTNGYNDANNGIDATRSERTGAKISSQGGTDRVVDVFQHTLTY